MRGGDDLLTDLYKLFLKFRENVPKNGRTAKNSLLGTYGTILFGDVEFVQKLFDTLIDDTNRVVVTFENTSRELYFYLKIFHPGTNFEKPEQKRVD